MLQGFVVSIFLQLVIMQLIPDISDSSGKLSLLILLIIILYVSSTEDALNNINRHKSHWEEKIELLFILPRVNFLKKKKDVEIDDIVKIYDVEYFLADLILFHSSDYCGAIFIETKNLDRETNLKDESFVGKIRIKFECEIPFEKLYFGSCHITSPNNPKEFEEIIDIGYDQFLPRSTSLDNTEWYYGCVVYTGHQTIIFRISCLSKYKWSHLESTIQKHVGILDNSGLLFNKRQMNV
ncbi:phospholipid-translocating ATPase, putative [Cryptosporidium muris RN66]|uniref:Phospholipid-translocating ATPase, putative n=1 Tax=Cryptosporidium muris (strain RN66) TaxID=441375 RepID=B6ADJ8_CRYMR|nr:phospholipid-translocating ATPase, putative [Cryptosporidium muris RN66]EEA06289.1 phospholipid-translocating ATPase, putative [Cryptosporidium muris RN66]|eukprot:XP_002140638.1 phospholipid-translocating ATPase [Cryptosporidium muris RN66]